MNSSSVIIPQFLPDPTRDIPSAEALYQLLVGELGLVVKAPRAGEFGWNRIVHDVTLRAMRETLRCSAGIANVKNLSRVSGIKADVLAALTAASALVLNPFDELSLAFASEDLRRLSSDITKHTRLDEKTLAEMFGDAGGDKPPGSHGFGEPLPDEAGGGAFIQIHIAEEAAAERKRPVRKLDI